MRIAVLADIHGNLLALEAVLADVAGEAPDLIVNLGDCLAGPLWPRETMERLAALEAPTVRGNHDRQMAVLPADAMGPSDRYAHDQVETCDLEWLGALPGELQVAPGVRAFHATPGQDDVYLLDEVAEGRLVRAGIDGIAARLGANDAGVVLCGHSHRPDAVRLPGGPLIVNPGSVGCPAYEDSSPPAHVSELGSPHARYAILDLRPGGDANVTFKAISYRHELAAQRAQANGRPEWAHALMTGLMPRR